LKRREFLKSAAIAGSAILCDADASLGKTIARLDSATTNAPAHRTIPGLDELAGDWIAAGIIDSLPSLTNFYGGLETSRNILGVQNFTIPPLAQGFELAALSLDGNDISAQAYRWYPYQLERKTRSNGVEVVTTVRMPFEGNGILLSVEVTNLSKEPWKARLAIGSYATIREYPETWVWKTPRPEEKDAADFSTSVVSSKGGRIFLSQDGKSGGKAAFAFLRDADGIADATQAASWNLHLRQGESFLLRAIMTAGSELDSVINQVSEWRDNFTGVWKQAKERWQQRFDAVFTPGNSHFSGNLPTLATHDSKVRRLYYTSILSLLCMERTNLNAEFPRVFVTGSPRYATSVLYFWDTSFFATVWSLLDPLAMKQQLRLFLESGIHSCYAIDFQSMQPIGRWYSANDYSVFRLVTTYIFVTGDGQFLEETLRGGETVIDVLEGLSLHWKALTKAPSLLANYGAAKNLLETVPTYVECVPSMNAANVWMLRSMAKLRSRRGEVARAAELKQQADQLAAEVLGLYVDGKGFWACRLEDGRRVEVRHCIDFFTVIDAMQSDLGQRRIDDMNDFVDRELWTPHWLRALSMQDAAAQDSLRPDHGSTGSYDAWPALTAEAMFRVGRKREALARLRDLEPATHEGPFGQSHDVATQQYPVRKAGAFGQEYFCSASGSFAEIILRTIFGFAPDANQEWHGSQPSVPGFDGQLINLRYGGKLLTVSVN
jgi:hypothetical protein